MCMLWRTSKEDGILGQGILEIKQPRSGHLISMPDRETAATIAAISTKCELARGTARAAESGINL